MLINLKRPSPVLIMITGMYVPICNRFHTIRVFDVSVRGEPPHPGAQNFVAIN